MVKVGHWIKQRVGNKWDLEHWKTKILFIISSNLGFKVNKKKGTQNNRDKE